MIISVLGCGWLGLPMAERLRDNGHTINGSTTTKDKLQVLNGKNIRPFYLNLSPSLNSDHDSAFWDANLLILNIPPNHESSDPCAYHSKQVREVIRQATRSSIENIIFISSTSVYPPQSGIVAEVDAVADKAASETGNALLKAENMLLEQSSVETLVLRFGGLYGYDRHPIHYLAGGTNLENGNAPVNLIHRDDGIGVISSAIQQSVSNGIFNVVSDGHPPRNMYYPAAAEVLGYPAPSFKQEEDNSRDKHKLVSNSKLKHQLGYNFKFPNPMDF